MIGAIQIYTIPAGGKSNVDHDTRRTRFLGKVESFVGAGEDVLKASVG
jgi:hypothetical protein